MDIRDISELNFSSLITIWFVKWWFIAIFVRPELGLQLVFFFFTYFLSVYPFKDYWNFFSIFVKWLNVPISELISFMTLKHICHVPCALNLLQSPIPQFLKWWRLNVPPWVMIHRSFKFRRWFLWFDSLDIHFKIFQVHVALFIRLWTTKTIASSTFSPSFVFPYASQLMNPQFTLPFEDLTRKGLR